MVVGVGRQVGYGLARKGPQGFWGIRRFRRAEVLQICSSRDKISKLEKARASESASTNISGTERISKGKAIYKWNCGVVGKEYVYICVELEE